MSDYLPEPCKKQTFYIIRLPRVQRGDGSGIDTSGDLYAGGAPKHRVRGPFKSGDEATKAYREMFDTEPALAHQCAVWYSSGVGD